MCISTTPIWIQVFQWLLVPAILLLIYTLVSKKKKLSKAHRISFWVFWILVTIVMHLGTFAATFGC